MFLLNIINSSWFPGAVVILSIIGGFVVMYKGTKNRND